MIPRTLEPEVMDTVEEAVDYDSMDHSTVNSLFVADLLRFVDQRKSATNTAAATVLDLGTGTALIPLEMLRVRPAVRSILACDLSVQMLKIAVQQIHRQKNDTAILPVLSDCKRLPLADSSCDIVMSNSIVHHIPNPIDVFREMRRVIRPGGVLFVRDLLRPDSVEDVERFVETYAGEENVHQRQMFRQSLHAALTVEEVRQLLSKTGFSSDAVNATSDRHWTVSCVAE